MHPSFWRLFFCISADLNTPKELFLSLQSPTKRLPIEIMSNWSVLCLWMCNIIRLFNLLSFIVARKYEFKHIKEENDLSLIAFVQGITSRSLTTFTTSERRCFLPALILLNILMSCDIFNFSSLLTDLERMDERKNNTIGIK